MFKRSLLALTILVAGCHKATPQTTSAHGYEAEQIRTLTHDEDLASKHAPDLSHLKLPESYLKGSPEPSLRP